MARTYDEMEVCMVQNNNESPEFHPDLVLVYRRFQNVLAPESRIKISNLLTSELFKYS